jgi:glycosyltransferase involved in cell wall biosynthesis
MNHDHAIRPAPSAPHRDDARPGSQPPELTEPLLSACLPAVPFIPTAAILTPPRTTTTGGPHRVAVVGDAIGAGHGHAELLHQLRAHGLPDCDLDLLDLPPARLLELPLIPGTTLALPSLSDIADTLTARGTELVLLTAPGPHAIATMLIAHALGLPLVAVYHAELAEYARSHSEDPYAVGVTADLLGAYFRACTTVLSPTRAADATLAGLGVMAGRIERWRPGVDQAHFHPARFARDALPHAIDEPAVTVLHAGRISEETGAGLLADAIERARLRNPRIRLVLAGDGPEREVTVKRLGPAAVCTGWLDRDALAHALASADLLVCPRRSDGLGQPVLEAQASGLPVLAVDAGGPAELIEPGRSGCLAVPEPDVIAAAICGLARRGALRERLATGGLLAVREHTWKRSLARLAAVITGDSVAPSEAGAESEPDAEVARAA